MKRRFDPEDFSEILNKAHEIMKAERKEALMLFSEMEEYYASVDFSAYPMQEIQMLTALTRYRIEEREMQKAQELMEKAGSIAHIHDLKGEQVRVTATLGVVHSLRGDHQKAIYTWEDLLADMEMGDFMWTMIVNNLIVAYSNTKQFSRAIDLSFKLLEYYEIESNTDGRLVALINLGNAYRPLRDFEKADIAYMEAIELAKEKENYPYLAYALSNRSSNLSDLKRYEEALDCAFETLEIHRLYFSEAHMAGTYTGIGSILIKMQHFEDALENLLKAEELLNLCEERSLHASTYLALGQACMNLNRLEEAKSYLHKAKEIADELDVNQLKINVCKIMAELHEINGEYREMANEYRRLTEIQQDQYEEVASSLISKQEAEYLRKKIQVQSDNYKTKNELLEQSNEMIIDQALKLKERNLELQNSMDTLNRLISVISHDVRGPAASTASVLRMILEDEMDESLKKELLKNLINSMDGVTDLLMEILLWIQSRNYSTGIETLMCQTEILPLVDNVLGLYSGQALQKRISVHKSFASEHLIAFTEPITLKIVLRNVLSNAFKYTPEGGSVNIDIRNIDQRCRICIEDNGVGMNAEMIDKLMKQELRSSPGTNKEHGTGMGLKLSFGYIKLLYADLKIVSEIGKGSQFIISIPISESGINNIVEMPEVMNVR